MHPPTIKRVGAHLAILTLLMLYMLPIAWMLSTALKPDEELFTEQIRWVPHRIAWEDTVVTAPLVLLFLLTQRAYVRDITLTGLKG